MSVSGEVAGNGGEADLWAWPRAEMWSQVWSAVTADATDDPEDDGLRRAMREDRLEEYWADRDVRQILAGLRAGPDAPDLERVPWQMFGLDEQIPGWLRRLRERDARVADRALSDLWNDVRHQGGVHVGAALIVPWLLRVAADRSAHHRDQVLLLAAEAGRRNHFGTDRRGDLLVAAEPDEMIDGLGYPVAWTIQAARHAIGADAGIVIALLDDPDPAVRCAAAYALAVALPPAPAVVEALRARLPVEIDPAARISLILGVAQLGRESGDPAAVEWAWGVWSDPAQPVDARFAAAIGWLCLTAEPAPGLLLQWLATVVPAVAEVLPRVPWPDDSDRDGVAAWLTRLLDEPNAQTVLLARLATSADAATRASACAAAQQLTQRWRPFTPAMVDLLADCLDDDEVQVRRAAARYLAQVGGATAGVADRLTEHLHEQDRQVRAWAAVGLAHAGDPRAVPALVQLLTDPVYPWPRAVWNQRPPTRLIDTLAAYATDLLPAVCHRLRQDDPSWRDIHRDLVRGLGSWGAAAAQAAPVLTNLLTASRVDCATVATTLAHIGTPAAPAGPILRQMARRDATHAATLVWAAWRVTGEDPEETAATLARLAATPPHGPEALRLLAELGPAAANHADTIRAQLSDGYNWTRVEAAHALWRCTGDLEQALPVLLRHVDRVEQPWTFWPVQILALRYLGHIGPAARAAVPTLQALLDTDQRIGSAGLDHDPVSWDEHCQDVARDALHAIRAPG